MRNSEWLPNKCFFVVASLIAVIGSQQLTISAPLGYFPPYSNYRSPSPFWEKHKTSRASESQEAQLVRMTLKELSKAGITKKNQDECIKTLSSIVSNATKQPAFQPAAGENVAQSLQHLASCCAQSGRDDLAEQISRCSLHLQPSTDLAASRRVEVLSNLAGLSYKSGDCNNAIALLNQAIEIESSYSFHGPSDTGLLLNHLARCYARAGKYQDSEKILERALATDRERMGEKSMAVAEDLYNIAVTKMLKGDYPTASNYLDRALSMLHSLPQDTKAQEQSWLKLHDELLRLQERADTH